MNLFNEFGNKNILLILQYLNLANQDPDQAKTLESLRTLLQGTKGNATASDLVDAILNLNPDPVKNLNLFYQNEEAKMLPVMNWGSSFPMPVTLSERSMLKSALLDPKSDLFLDAWCKQQLLVQLEDVPAPANTRTIQTIRETENEPPYSLTYQTNFKSLLFYQSRNQFVEFEQGDELLNLLVFKIIYHQRFDSFVLFAYCAETKDIKEIPLSAEFYVDKSTYGRYKPQDFDGLTYEEFYVSMLEKHQAKQPLKVRLTVYQEHSNHKKARTMADDRFLYLFSDYETFNYRLENGDLISQVEYYDFQYDDILSKILSLGKYIEVLEPKAVRQDIIDILTRKTQNYKIK